MLLSFSELLPDMRAADYPIAFQGDIVIGYSQFIDDVARSESMLSEINSEAVALVSSNSYEFVVGFLALLRLGRNIAFPQNDKPEVLEALLADGIDLLQNGKLIATSTRKTSTELGRSKNSKLTFFTSGSTGQPKAVHKDLAQIENEIKCLEKQWGEILRGCTVLASVSHQHIYGMLFKVFWPLCAGRPFIVDSFDYWEELTHGLPSKYVVVSSPAHLSRFPLEFDLEGCSLPAMVFSSGGPLPYDAAKEAVMRLHVYPMEVYGSTETGGIAYRQQDDVQKPWQAFEVVQLAEEEGALSVVSPFIGSGETFITNDRVEFFPNNCFVLRGRNDRIVKVEGKRVSLPELEENIRGLPWVDDAVCLILKDQRESLSTIVKLSKEGRALQSEMGDFRLNRKLREDLSNGFDLVTLPRRWRFLEEIPQNSQGKRIFSELSALFD